MYNLRYHIVSIAAVFLALALGLVLGGLIGDKALSTTQESLSSGILVKNNQLREENTRLAARNNLLTTFGNDGLAQLAGGRLNGKRVLLIGAQGAASKRASQVLQQAGATLVLASIDENRYKADDKNLASAKLIADLKTRYHQTDDLAALAAGFAAEWSQSATATAGPATAGAAVRPVTAALQTDGILKLSGDFTGVATFDGVVDVALGAKGAPDTFGLQLARALSQRGTPTIAAQMDGSLSTLGVAAVELKLSATNLLGTPPGDWTVVAVLSGAPAATYGTLEGANQAYPPVK
ncbi:MAG: copper transporter [Actinomycetia bacterium]|nr:copper transporter [Actinomycetes bacterium]